MKNHASSFLKEKDDISNQMNSQIFEFCDPDQLFPETLQNSEVTSCSNGCYEENSPYATQLPLPPDIEKFNSYQDNNANTDNAATAPTPTTTSTTSTTTTATTAATNNNTNNTNNMSIIFDTHEEIDNDISASIDFSPSPPFSVPHLILTSQQEQFDYSSVEPQISLADNSVIEGLSHYPSDSVGPIMPGPLPSVFEEDCLSSVPSYVALNPSSPSCAFLGSTMGTYLSAGAMNAATLSADNSGIFAGSILMASELQPQELEYQGDSGGIYCPDSIQRVFNPGELQRFRFEGLLFETYGPKSSMELHRATSTALSTESQQLVAVGGAGNSTSLATEIPNMGDQNFKVGKLSVEQRKEKIHRYMKKRNERNFSKKIKYACRKTLADSRPRVRGRFAKNDDFGETPRPACSNHEEEEDEEVVVKEEDEMVDSSDIFAHISGVNSFKCNYPIQSWI
ncbi:uncharacterized protein LOC107422801 isoform X2 [Ziziphus jujuba]|uniref:Uncharacterized protein LOC107422801 isoform X2 n=1 Tax=Ziziphus jujuba TaxID=326968 RepID=A0A6P6GAV7_ZIZJJ|nr:uncharacterized protein LOC107422801 isoform X2 [Ziziphus jujuba]